MKIEEPPINSLPNLKGLDFTVPKLATMEEPKVLERKKFNAVFNGVPVEVGVESESHFSSELDHQLYYINIKIKVFTKTEKDVARVVLCITRSKENVDTYYYASTNVRNMDRNMSGLGRDLWEIQIQLIQKIANEKGISIEHEVDRMPDKGLSQTKWDELFLPLLDKYGYKLKQEGEWVRMYFPHKK